MESDKAYEAGRKKGLAKGAYKRGYEEGKRHGMKGQSRFGALGAIGDFITAHPMDIGETSKRMGSDHFGFGGSPGSGGSGKLPIEGELGFGPAKKKKGRSLEDELGL